MDKIVLTVNFAEVSSLNIHALNDSMEFCSDVSNFLSILVLWILVSFTKRFEVSAGSWANIREKLNDDFGGHVGSSVDIQVDVVSSRGVIDG